MPSSGEPLLPEGSQDAGVRLQGNSTVSQHSASAIAQQHAGLTSQEATEKLLTHGYNELASTEVNPCMKFLAYFWGPMPCMIWVAIIVELVEAFNDPQHWLDFGVLMTLQIVNGLVGWYEERNAGNAIAALKKELALYASVKRDGQWQRLPARELVPGDVVHLKLGDVVPADCQLLADASGLPIQVDQSALNGESLPKTVHAGGKVFQGTIVKRGEIDGLVTETGAETFFGRASQLVATAEKSKLGGGHFQRLVTTLTLGLLCLAVVCVTTLSVKLLLQGEPILGVISIAVILLVASIPIAMQVVCTSTMAVGSHKLAKAKALVCKLTAIEELATMKILCSDKTGTLTKNELTVCKDLFVLNEGKVSDNELLFIASLAANRGGSEQDAIDKCICDEVERRKMKPAADAHSSLHFVPFDPVTKRTEAVVEGKGPAANSVLSKEWQNVPFRVMKGAPQVVLQLSKDCAKIHDKVADEINLFASKGYRTLGIARAPLPKKGAADAGPIEWEFMGLLPLEDPPRHDTEATVQKATRLGVEVKMITGDQTAIAKETARKLGMGMQIFNADALQATDSRLQAAQLGEMVENASGFAEVFPEHKFQIVQILQERGHRCGMTGDGVNDAPALKASDVGIAVKGSTDAARAAADIVLTSDGLSVIIEAIRQSRMIFERMRNYCIYRIACTTNLLFFFFFSMMFINPDDFAPSGMHISDKTFRIPVLCLVLITLLNDGCILSIAYDKVTPSSQPCSWNLKEVVYVACLLGFISLISAMVLLVAGLFALDPENKFSTEFWNGKLGLPNLTYPQLQCMLYLDVSLSGFLTIFIARTRSHAFSRRPGPQLFVAGIFALTASTILSATEFIKAVTGASETSGLPIGVVGIVWAWCVFFFFVQDICKILLIRAMDKMNGGSPEANLLGSSFWAMGGDVASPSIAVGNRGSRSLLHAAQSALADRSPGANASQTEEIQRYDAKKSELLGQVNEGGSVLGKGSIISASLSADPRAVVAGSGEKGTKEARPSVGAQSTAAGSDRPSLPSSVRPSAGMSLWSTNNGSITETPAAQ